MFLLWTWLLLCLVHRYLEVQFPLGEFFSSNEYVVFFPLSFNKFGLNISFVISQCVYTCLYHCSICFEYLLLSQFLRVVFDGFLGWLGLLLKPFMFLLLIYASAIISSTARVAPLIFTVSRRSDHRLPLVTAQTWLSFSRTPNADKTLRGSLDHGHQHGLRWQRRPLTSIWPPAAAWLVDIGMVSGCS